jgi:hypothetical protein
MGWCPRPGDTMTVGVAIDQDSSAYPVTLTGARLTGARDLRVDRVWAYFVRPGMTEALGTLRGYPPRWMQHRLPGLVVPPGVYVDVLFTVTATRPDASYGGEDVSYVSGRQGWTQDDQTSLAGGSPACHVRR